jgi:putative transposase
MPRLARIVVPHIPHHVTQRGNNRQEVFLTDEDRRTYLEILRKQSERYGLVVEGYCLMTNHVHLVVVPERVESLAKAVGRTHFLYSVHFNRLHARSGHLWQSRFYSCPMDDRHALAAVCYVERNPTRAGMSRRAWDWEWSSARAHCGKTDEAGLLDLKEWKRRIGARDWRKLLGEWGEEKVERPLRERTSTGRPLGSERFLNELETLLGRRARPFPIGRPSKNGAEDNR